eukprot:Em0014g368a
MTKVYVDHSHHLKMCNDHSHHSRCAMITLITSRCAMITLITSRCAMITLITSRGARHLKIGTSEYGTPPRLVLLQGEQGVGKTHLSRHLSLMWRDRRLFQNHTLFLLLPLRDPHLRTASTLSSLIHHPDPAIGPAVARWMTERRGQGCLLLLDGYSDLPLAVQWTSIYADIVKGVALEEATVVVTSQSHPSILREPHLLPSQPGTQAFQHVEVLGFSQSDVASYALSAFRGDEVAVESFLSYLDSNPAIHSLVHVPLYCAAVLEIYSQLRGQDGDSTHLPRTLTRLHDHFVFGCITKALEIQLPPLPPAVMVGRERVGLLRSLPGQAQDLLNQICQLAYEGLVQGDGLYQDVGDGLLTLSLFETVPTLHLDGHTHYFLHKHLHHYLASRHLALTSPPRRRANLIKEASILPQMAPVLRHLAGRSGEEEPPPPTTLLSWFGHTPTLDLEFLCDLSANFLDGMHCIHEAQTPQDLGKVIVKMERNYIHPRPLSLLDCYVIGYCIVNSGLEWGELECNSCRMDERGVAKMALPRDGAGRMSFSLVVSLNMSHNPICDSGLEHIVSAMRGNHSLETLHLESCHITSKGVEHLAEVLKTDHTLVVLNLSNNSIGNSGARHLATTLRVNLILCRLLLCGCGIGEEGASELAQALLSNTSHLQMLDVRGNLISPSSQLTTVMGCLVNLNEPTS